MNNTAMLIISEVCSIITGIAGSACIIETVVMMNPIRRTKAALAASVLSGATAIVFGIVASVT